MPSWVRSRATLRASSVASITASARRVIGSAAAALPRMDSMAELFQYAMALATGEAMASARSIARWHRRAA